MQKSKYVYKSMVHYRRKFFLVILIMALFFAFFTVSKLPYLKAEWFGSSSLDIKKFVSETDTITVDSLIELGRKDSKTPDDAVFRSNSYWQEDNYLFGIKASSITDTGKVFKTTITVGDEVQEVDMYRVYIAKVGGVNTAVLAKADKEPTVNMKGYITEMQKPVLAYISETLKDGQALEISEYFIDLRGGEMDTSSTDTVMFWFFLALLLILAVKLALYYIKPTLTPTYRQLARYGDMLTIEEDINKQAESPDAYTEGGKLVLEDYIITKSTFKIIVNKNHLVKN